MRAAAVGVGAGAEEGAVVAAEEGAAAWSEEGPRGRGVEVEGAPAARAAANVAAEEAAAAAVAWAVAAAEAASAAAAAASRRRDAERAVDAAAAPCAGGAEPPARRPRTAGSGDTVKTGLSPAAPWAASRRAVTAAYVRGTGGEPRGALSDMISGWGSKKLKHKVVRAGGRAR
jgi:hypothetical protein